LILLQASPLLLLLLRLKILATEGTVTTAAAFVIVIVVLEPLILPFEIKDPFDDASVNQYLESRAETLFLPEAEMEESSLVILDRFIGEEKTIT
jgi:hypothetical protein